MWNILEHLNLSKFCSRILWRHSIHPSFHRPTNYSKWRELMTTHLKPIRSLPSINHLTSLKKRVEQPVFRFTSSISICLRFTIDSICNHPQHTGLSIVAGSPISINKPPIALVPFVRSDCVVWLGAYNTKTLQKYNYKLYMNEMIFFNWLT